MILSPEAEIAQFLRRLKFILLAGLFYIVSLFVAPQGGVLSRLLRLRVLPFLPAPRR